MKTDKVHEARTKGQEEQQEIEKPLLVCRKGKCTGVPTTGKEHSNLLMPST
jgi:hypothetical protein